MDHETLSDAATDIALIDRIRAGSEDALVSLYRRRRRDVYLFALAMGKSASLAEDVTQEVFLNVIENAARFDPAKGLVRAWLLGCARYELIDHLRRERRHTSDLPELDVPAEADDFVHVGQRSERLHAAIALLPLEYREALVLRELQELSYAETAAVLQCPLGTVRSRLHRARAMLVTLLGPAEPVVQDAREARPALNPNEVYP